MRQIQIYSCSGIPLISGSGLVGPILPARITNWSIVVTSSVLRIVDHDFESADSGAENGQPILSWKIELSSPFCNGKLPGQNGDLFRAQNRRIVECSSPEPEIKEMPEFEDLNLAHFLRHLP